MFHNQLLLAASLGVLAWALYCSRAVPEDESAAPRHVSDDDAHWSDRPRRGHGAMRGLLSDAQAATAAAEAEKRERREAAAAAEAQYEDVDSKLHAKSLRVQQHKKFE